MGRLWHKMCRITALFRNFPRPQTCLLALQPVKVTEEGGKGMPTQQIEDLIGRMALGDRRALSQLYDRTAAKLFGICLGILKEREAAEDAMQEAFVKIWRNAGRYQVNGLSPMTWLITIARNTAIDALRARQRADVTTGVDQMDALPAGGLTPEGAAIAASEAGRIAACMGELEDAHRRAVRGAYLEGLSYADLAAAAEVPINTMRTWLRRSLLRLKECLQR